MKAIKLTVTAALIAVIALVMSGCGKKELPNNENQNEAAATQTETQNNGEKTESESKQGIPDAGQRPTDGQAPGNGQRPGNGERPADGQRPAEGQRPNGGVRPAGVPSNPEGRPVMSADLSGVVKEINGDIFTLMVMGAPANAQNDGQPRPMEITGEEVGVKVPEAVTIVAMVNENGSFVEKPKPMSEIKPGDLMMITYTDKEKKEFKKIVISERRERKAD